MKATKIFLSLTLIAGLGLSGCEKFELEEHCPEEEQNIDYNPQDLRVNDDTDNEEELGSEVSNQTLDGSGVFDGSLTPNTYNNFGNDSGDGDGDDVTDDGDDTVNDDSDNEDEHPRRPKNPSGADDAASNR